MASSREPWRRAAVSLLVAASLALCAPTCAQAASSLDERVADPVLIERLDAQALVARSTAVLDATQLTQTEIDEDGEETTVVTVTYGEATISLPRLCPSVLSVTCDPASIEAGVDCGMDWMCGIYPCLCGSADEWGGCSCNGLETECPTLSYESSDEDVVRVVQALGRTWLVPTGTGRAVLTCTASLEYYEDTTAQVTVVVEGPTASDAALVAACLAVLALIVAAAVGVFRLVRRLRARAACGEEGVPCDED